MGRFNLKVLLILSLGHMVTDIYQGALPAHFPFLKDKTWLNLHNDRGNPHGREFYLIHTATPLWFFIRIKKERCFPSGFLQRCWIRVLAMPTNYYVVLFLVVISGLGVAAYHPEGYKTAHFFTGERSVTGMSVFSVGGNLGLAMGPLWQYM